MKVITNEEIIAKRKKWASILAPAAMVLLLGGLATNFMSLRSDDISPMLFYATLVLLLLGFLLSSASSNLVNRWVKEPRADQILSKNLKGFDNKHVLLNYTSRSPHILIAQNKVFAITAKPQKGEIEVNGLKWKRKFEISRIFRFFAEENLGNPSIEAKRNSNKLSDLIQKELPEESASIPIEPVVVFTNPDVDLAVENSEIPILKSGQLKQFVRESTKGSAIKTDLRQKLIRILGQKQK